MTQFLILGHQPAKIVTQGFDHRAGERSQIDHVFWRLLITGQPAGVGDTIGQYQPPLGIGVIDFHG
ncbi:hypothetical protein D3C71_1924740 [compost metagenome]